MLKIKRFFTPILMGMLITLIFVGQAAAQCDRSARSCANQNNGQVGNSGEYTPSQRVADALDRKNPVAYYEARSDEGEEYARTALSVVENRGWLGQGANSRLAKKAEKHAVTYDQWEVNVELMFAHDEALRNDPDGDGRLSPAQITEYHHRVFQNMGLPRNTFGGTPISGHPGEAGFTSWRWCPGCDTDR